MGERKELKERRLFIEGRKVSERKQLIKSIKRRGNIDRESDKRYEG